MAVKQAYVDIESHFSEYGGRSKLVRLFFIASELSVFKEEALRLAFVELDKTGLDTGLYQDFHTLAGQEPSPVWISQAQSKKNARLQVLLEELQLFQEHYIKDSVKLSYHQLGLFYFQYGESQLALKAFLAMRDYCVLPSDNIELAYHFVRISLETSEFSLLNSWAQKAIQLFANEKLKLGPGSHALLSKIHAALGYSLLVDRNEQSISLALQNLLSFFHLRSSSAALEKTKTSSPDPNSSSSQPPSQHEDFFSYNDVIRMTCLCILAGYERLKIHQVFLSKDLMKKVFESMPEMLDLLNYYVQGKFLRLFSKLNDELTYFKIDVYLSQIYHFLHEKIIQNCLLAYFRIFKRAELSQASDYLQISSQELLSRVQSLISSNKLDSKIDFINKRVISSQCIRDESSSQDLLCESLLSNKIKSQDLVHSASMALQLLEKNYLGS